MVIPKVVIHDGNPWWQSPDIFTLQSPSGPPATPEVGKQIYVAADVFNEGDGPAGKVTVYFWWADPSTQVRADDATYIGKYIIEVLNPNSKERVVCPQFWTPVFVNGGHECLLVFADDTFGSIHIEKVKNFPVYPAAHDEMAQLNLTLQNVPSPPTKLKMWAAEDRDKHVSLHAEMGGTLDGLRLARLGIEGYRLCARPQLEVSLGRADHPVERQLRPYSSDRGLDLHIPRGGVVGVDVQVEAPGLQSHEYAVVDVVERERGQVVGGCSFVIVAETRRAEPAGCSTIILADPK